MPTSGYDAKVGASAPGLGQGLSSGDLGRQILTQSYGMNGAAAPVAVATVVTNVTERNVEAFFSPPTASDGAIVIGVPADASSATDAVGYFQRYDAINSELAQLQNAESGLQVANGNVTTNKKRLHQLRSARRTLEQKKKKLAARIERNAHPHFLHYLQVDRKGKVARLRGDMEKLNGQIANVEANIQQASTALSQANSQYSAFTNAVSRKNQLRAEKTAIFNSVIKSMTPTARLRQIAQNQNDQKMVLLAEQNLSAGIRNCLYTARSGMQQYQQSMQMLQRAMRNNRGAAVTNLFGGGGPEMFETMQQASRDRLINQAQIPADRAARAFVQAYAAFPAEARSRYPALCTQIGKVPFPRLRNAHFGGTMATKFIFGDIGDAFNDMHAGNKIRENMGIVQQCSQIAARQVQLIVAVEAAVGQNMAAMSNQLNMLNAQENEEKNTMFATRRSEAGC